MSQSLVVLRECADRIEAETIRIRLAADGITAFITGTDAAIALSMGGAGTLRLVRVEVALEDLEAATALLEADALRMQGAEPWICGRCHEKNEPSFDICWSCSKPRAPDDQEVAPGPTQADRISVEVPDPIEEDLNPYRPVLISAEEEPDRVLSKGTIEERVNRAFRASIVGALLFPPLVTLYSVYCLVDLTAGGALTDARFNRRIMFTWIINLIVIAVSVVFWFRLI